MKEEKKARENSKTSCHDSREAPCSGDNGKIKLEGYSCPDFFDRRGLAVAVYEAVDEGKDFVFREFNRAGEKIELIKREDLLGKSVQDVFPSIGECGLFDGIVRVWQTGIPELHPPVYYRDNRIEGWRENYMYRLPSGEVVTVYDDVTEKKSAEGALKESKRKHTTLISNLQGMVYSCLNDGHWTMQFVSAGALELTGYSPEELVWNRVVSYGKIIHEEDRNKVWKIIRQNLETKSKFTLEYRIVTREGSIKWVWERGQGIFSENGELLGIEGFITDVSGMKQAEKVLEESEERYRMISEIISDYAYSFRVEPDGRLEKEWIVGGLENITGFTPEEISRRGGWSFLVHPDDTPVVRKRSEKLLAGLDDTSEFRIVRKDGTHRWLQDFARPVWNRAQGRVVRIYGAVRDITFRRQSEKALNETLDRLRRITGSIIEVIVAAVEARDPYTAGHQRRVGDLARAIATEMGLPPEEVEGIRIAGVIHDLGKISIPAEILSKPRQLTDMEFALMKEHPQKGYEILCEVDFDWPVADMVRQHHERLDGSGYPQGIEGDEIILGARILAVADVVEAMASHRPYRPNLGIEAALQEITSGRGVLYDPEVVDACLRLFKKKRYRLPTP